MEGRALFKEAFYKAPTEVLIGFEGGLRSFLSLRREAAGEKIIRIGFQSERE